GGVAGMDARHFRFRLHGLRDNDDPVCAHLWPAYRSLFCRFRSAGFPSAPRCSLFCARIVRRAVEHLSVHGAFGHVQRLLLDLDGSVVAGNLRGSLSRCGACARGCDPGFRNGGWSRTDRLPDRFRRFLSAADCRHGSLLLCGRICNAHGFTPPSRTRLANGASLRYVRAMSVTVRFAPSPTGRVHIGNARTALFNWLFARKAHGRFVLRFDDTDVERSREEYADAIEADLAWLGIKPDLVVRQSDRFALYGQA